MALKMWSRENLLKGQSVIKQKCFPCIVLKKGKRKKSRHHL